MGKWFSLWFVACIFVPVALAQAMDSDGDGIDDVDDKCPMGDTGWVSDVNNNPNTTDYDNDGCQDAGEDDDDDNDLVLDGADDCDPDDSTTDPDDPGSVSSNLGWVSDINSTPNTTDYDNDGCQDSMEDTDDDNDRIADVADLCDPDDNSTNPKDFGTDNSDLGWQSDIDNTPNSTDYDADGCQDSMEDTDDDDDDVTDVTDLCDPDDNSTNTDDLGISFSLLSWGSDGGGSLASNDYDGDGCHDTSEDDDDDNDGVNDGPDRCDPDPSEQALASQTGWTSSGVGSLGGTDYDGDGCRDSDEDDDDDGDLVLDPADLCDPDDIPPNDGPFASSSNVNPDANGNGCNDITEEDTDNDNVPDGSDNCPGIQNASQLDTDMDGLGDECDTCPTNRGLWLVFVDADGDGCDDATEDFCPATADPTENDADFDGCTDSEDDCDSTNALAVAPFGSDYDMDGCENAEDDDDDNDAILDAVDECDGPFAATNWNPDSDNDKDADGCRDADEDTCVDVDSDGFGDPSFPVPLTCGIDNCVDIANASQADIDIDGVGDVCDACSDADGDGFGDPDLNIQGVTMCIDDCDDGDPNEQPDQLWYTDCDRDGVRGAPVMSCTTPVATCTFDGMPAVFCANCAPPVADCDDDDPGEFPNQTWFPDCDGDLAFSSSSVAACSVEDAEVALVAANDCAQAPVGGWMNVGPAAGTDDCDDEDAQRVPGQRWWADCDQDTFTTAELPSGCDPTAALAIAQQASPSCGQALLVNAGTVRIDCNDGNANVAPLLEEQCETTGQQIDNDCDGSTETWIDGAGVTQTATQAQSFWPDLDGDTFGDDDEDAVEACQAPANTAPNNFDCDDTSSAVFPEADEICNSIDENCNGLIDEVDFLAETGSGCFDLYLDRDGDGFGDLGATRCLCPTPRPDGSVGATLDNDEYVSTFSDCDDLHAWIRPHQCNDGLDNDGDGAVDRVSSPNFPDGDPDCAPTPDGRLPTVEGLGEGDPKREIIDGHDNDCDGRIPLIELDCDDDGSFPLVDVSGLEDGVSFEVASEIGLADCSGDPITVSCFGDTLTLECDEGITGLWMFRYSGDEDGFGGRYAGGFRNLTSTTCSTLGDCDDTCAERCPGRNEVCDGLDNDCTGVVLDVDDDGVPPALDSIVTGTVALSELDLDGDGFSSCDQEFRPSDFQVQRVAATCGDELDAAAGDDCDDLCFASGPDTAEVCNGFVDTCTSTDSVDGTDQDSDGHVACGAFTDGDTELVEEVYAVVWANCTPNSDGLCVESNVEYVPLMLPRRDPQGGLVVCDSELYSALEPLLDAAIAADPNLSGTAAQILSNPESSSTDLLPICDGANGGVCTTVALALQRSADGREAADTALANGLTTQDCVDAPEQYALRTVWSSRRIVDTRRAVVEWDCRRMFGASCSELFGTEAQLGSPLPPNLDLALGPDQWWVELGRYVPQSVGGPLMTCWGDPRDAVRGVSDLTGGDCNDSRRAVHRDAIEGPFDVVALFDGTEVDCSLCRDGIDNNCDGTIDCADPSCAVCFVGQGAAGGCGLGSNTCDGEATEEGGCAVAPATWSRLVVIPLFISLFLFRRTQRKERPCS